MGRRRSGRALDGVLLLDKPSGITSFKAVDRCRRALDAAKAGHTGTLDPLATGLMQICFGRGTRLVQFLTGLDKRYRADVALGASTTTYDAEGDVTATADPSQVAALTRATIEAALAPLRGSIEQRPPAYSAIKVDGQRLYARARRGEVVEAPVRSVVVHSLEVVEFAGDRLVLDVHCSKGTYIRSIAADLGEALGVGAHLAGLRRTAIGRYDVADAVTLEAIEAAPEAVTLGALVDYTGEFPTVDLDPEGRAAIRAGRRIPAPAEDHPRWRALAEDGSLLALLERDGETLRVLRGFH